MTFIKIIWFLLTIMSKYLTTITATTDSLHIRQAVISNNDTFVFDSCFGLYNVWPFGENVKKCIYQLGNEHNMNTKITSLQSVLWCLDIYVVEFMCWISIKFICLLTKGELTQFQCSSKKGYFYLLTHLFQSREIRRRIIDIKGWQLDAFCP